MIDQNHMDNEKYIKCQSNILTHNVICTSEIKSWTAMVKTEFNEIFHQKIGLKFQEGTSQMLQF
jgi:hypothetical protein